jgi:hypothetical protein
MATIKRLNSDYTIDTTANGAANVYVNTNTVTINGDLIVAGQTTSITTTNTTLADNIIVLNKGEQGAGVTKGFAGIEIDRGTQANVQLRWNESYLKWQITDGTTIGNLAAYSNFTFISNVIQDPTPWLGGNLNTRGFTIYSNFNRNVLIDSPMQFITRSNIAVSTVDSGNVVVYSNAVSGGGSGIYVANSTGADQELVTKRKAIVYALIF